MQISKNLLGILSAALVLTACNNVDFKKTTAGVPYKILGNGKGDSIRTNNIVKFEVIQKTKDTVIFSSYKQGQPQYLQMQTIPPSLNYNDIGGNLMEILAKAKKGDSIYISQSADSLLKDPRMAQTPLPFKKGDQIITTVKIVEVYKTPEEAQAASTKDRLANSEKLDKDNLERFQKDTMVQSQMAKDNKMIEDYLAKNNIQTQKTDWGVYLQIVNPGQGPKPKVGQFVQVHYTVSSLDGKTFETGTYPMQIGMGGSIKGFEEGVKQLAKGGKAKAYVPSMLGYGPQGSGKIGPNEVLVFDLEVLDILDKQPAPAQQPGTDTTAAKSK